MRGRDTHGPTALLKSAMKIDQVPYQATLLNMKFHPSALQSKEDMKKLADLMKIYFANGGKHVQFNVVNAETLIEAQKEPEHHRDLVVRVAGYSAYFVELSRNTQKKLSKGQNIGKQRNINPSLCRHESMAGRIVNEGRNKQYRSIN